MPATNSSPYSTDLRIECYVRSTVPGPIAETIDAVVDRLQRLGETGQIADYELCCWPPAHDRIADAIASRTRTREDLLTAFERWADRHGYSLQPAFRRETVPSSPLGCGPDPPRERVRVPLIALAVHGTSETDGGSTEIETSNEEGATDMGTLRGIAPCTEPHRGRTYTIDALLSAIESGEPLARMPHYGAATAIDGNQ